MARRKEGGIETISTMPWPVGIVLGIGAFIVVRYGVGWFFASHTNPVLAGLGKAAAQGAYAPIAWVVLFACWLGAALSFMKQRTRRRILETQTGLESIRSIHWKVFELLVGEAFRRQGYAVEETGLGGPDGGVDLVLRKHGQVILVQCKQWRTRQVTVKVVREMFGLLNHHGANAVIIVSTGEYTADARAFARGKPIELINGDQLTAIVRDAQTSPNVAPASIKKKMAEPATTPAAAPTPTPVPVTVPVPEALPTTDTPACPACGNAMVRRQNRTTHASFWGCQNYPRCKGTRTGHEVPA